MSTIYSVCALLRYEIEEGLRRLRDVKPAGETYMHEGIKQVIFHFHVRIFFPNILIIMKLSFDRMFVMCFVPEGLSSDTDTNN